MAIFNSKLFVYQRVTFPGTVSLSWSMSRPRCEASKVSPVSIQIDHWIIHFNRNFYCKPSSYWVHLSGWWCNVPILKNMSSSMGRMTSHLWNGKYNSCSKPPTSYGNPHLGFWKKVCNLPFSLDLLTGTCWKIPKFTSAKKAQRPAMELMTEGKSPAVFGLYSYDVPCFHCTT